MANKKKQDAAGSEGDAEPGSLGESKSAPAPRARKPKSETTDESATGKAKSAAKRVAAAVSDTVKEIAEKVTKKTTRSTTTRKTASAKAASAEGDESSAAKKAPARTSASKDSAADAESTPKPTARKASNRTKTAALAEGTTSDDVNDAILDLLSSGDVPAEHADMVDSPADVRAHFLEEQHLHKGPPPPQPPRDLPDEYGDTKIVLLVRDPEWVYAYWEINDDTRAQLNFPRNGNGNQNRRLVLRIYKITDTAWPVDAAHYFFDVDVPSEAKNWYIHLPEADQQWCAELGLVDNTDNFITICRSNPVVTPRNTISERVDSDWMTVQESFEKITRLSRASVEAQLQGAGGPGGSEAILRTINRQLTAVLHGEKLALSSGIFSSEAAIPGRRKKDFWLQVHTELILYGATEPDAKVTVQGAPVTLNEDGTFSLRFALPEGLQVLDVRAVNADGDMEEEIIPVVERTTRYP
jgi:hypothetical protein